MKIGLLSYHRNYNYGWNLQCFALMTVLKALGHEVIYIDKRQFSSSSGWISFIKGHIRLILEALHILKRNMTYEDVQSIKGKNTALFFDNYIVPRTKPIFSYKGLKKLPHFDALVVGSDQCWRSSLVKPLTAYFFDFVNYPCKKISYAASMGSGDPEYSEDEIRACGNLVRSFDAVSLRELEGVNLIKNVYKWDCNPCQMPDPTLLLDPSVYLGLVPHSFLSNKSEGIFAYILDETEDKSNCLKKLEDRLGLSSYSLDINPSGLDAIPPIEEWLSNFINSDIVFTDSFHGVIFSLIFRKPFIVYANKARGISRFLSILNLFNQNERLIYNYGDLTEQRIDDCSKIDEKVIEANHTAIMKQGIDFLKDNLK